MATSSRGMFGGGGTSGNINMGGAATGVALVYTLTEIQITSTEAYQLETVNINHDIFQISYDLVIFAAAVVTAATATTTSETAAAASVAATIAWELAVATSAAATAAAESASSWEAAALEALADEAAAAVVVAAAAVVAAETAAALAVADAATALAASVPSLILPNAGSNSSTDRETRRKRGTVTVEDGYAITLVNTSYLTIYISAFDAVNEKISSWGLTGITGEQSMASNSTWSSTAATNFSLPPYMSITLRYIDSVWYSSMS